MVCPAAPCVPALSAQAMRARFQLPFGAIVHPMAGAQDLPVIGLDAGGIVRCRRCRTYINPFVTWSDNGRWGDTPLHSLLLTLPQHASGKPCITRAGAHRPLAGHVMRW